MNLLAKILRRLWAKCRIVFYKFISTAKILGKPLCLCPVLAEGPGRISVGKNVQFGFEPDTGFWNGYVFLNPRSKESKISFGEDCILCNRFTAIAEGPGIFFGNKVLVGSDVEVYDSDFHEIAPEHRLGGCPKMGRVVIGDNVWIGNRVTILKGSEIGANSVVAAGAVVAGKFPTGVIIGGVPAKIIGNVSSNAFCKGDSRVVV
ncbi:MAG: acyltransferase [Fibrobacteraceae bacterium]|nr:acyltransferase [Fibrobacteraceae bacterium]